MVQLTTQRVKISVESLFQDQYSSAVEQRYIFAYRIQIHNESPVPIQLLSRRWNVIGATGERRQIEGEGVVGQQPVILPGQSHEYTSWVQFETPLGAMVGSYLMSRPDTRGRRELFRVRVPKFVHMAPELLN